MSLIPPFPPPPATPRTRWRSTLGKRLRARQVKMTASAIHRLSYLPGIPRLLCRLKTFPLTRTLLQMAQGYMRIFPSLADAERAIAPFSEGGHQSEANVELHLAANEYPRPSDYPAFFYLEPLLMTTRHLFDLGGNVGHLFYCYSRYLEFPPGFQWQVLDLPINMACDRLLAAQRQTRQLTFADRWSDASGADILLASGCLHHFPRALPALIAELQPLRTSIPAFAEVRRRSMRLFGHGAVVHLSAA